MTLATAELFKKAKKIEIASRRLVDQQLAGQYHSVFKGRGLVFSDVRPYYAGDDVRSIDWNITARMNAPHVKQFVEERDRTVNLVIDMSASGSFGSRGAAKRELAAELAAVVDPLEWWLPPVGLLQLEDLETGEVVELDTSGAAGHEFRANAAKAAQARDAALRRLNVDVVTVTTDQPYVDALIAFFKARAK